MSDLNKINKVFEVDPLLEIKEKLVSIHALNPFVANDSSARSYMFSSHLSQAITLEHGDERIIQSGLESQFGQNTFSKKTESDIRILKIIPRYRGIDQNSINAVTELFIMFENLDTGEIDHINIPYYFTLHQYFGFKYKWNNDVLGTLMPGTVLPKGTILADSPSVDVNSGYKFGANLNIALMTIPETAEDGVVISQSMSKKLSYKIFETRVVEFGTDSFPLNIYGDDENYKAFPDIGEQINDDSVIMALRDYDQALSPALVSVKDVQSFNPIFDKAVYVKGPGSKVNDGEGVIKSGVVVDIKAYHSPKFKKEIYTETAGDVQKYVNGYKRFYQDILDQYDKLRADHYRMYKNNDLRISEQTHRLLIDAYAILNNKNHKINYSFRNEPLDIYRIEFTIEYTINPSVGAKITDGHGKVFN
jgi:hypothetical protein